MKSSRLHFHLMDSPGTLHNVLASHVASDIGEAIGRKGYASVAFSGGNTPRPFLQQLAQENIAWEHVRIGLVDERWVGKESGDSNESLIRSELLERGANAATLYGMYREGKGAEEASAEVDAVYREALFPFDVVVLGMGADGHTASLFPGRVELAHLLNDPVICGAAEAPSEPKERLSLSLHAIATAANCYLHIEGAEKLVVYEAAFDGEDVTELPIRAVLGHPDIAPEIYYS